MFMFPIPDKAVDDPFFGGDHLKKKNETNFIWLCSTIARIRVGSGEFKRPLMVVLNIFISLKRIIQPAF